MKVAKFGGTNLANAEAESDQKDKLGIKVAKSGRTSLANAETESDQRKTKWV
jgi:hypothetical protein